MSVGVLCDPFCAWQATEDQILELMDALGSVISYVREDEQLQLSAALRSEDLTPAHLDADVSAGGVSLRTPWRISAAIWLTDIWYEEHLHVAVYTMWLKKNCGTCCAGLWGLDRIDVRSPIRNFKYTYAADGTGVHIYVIDTVRC